MRYFFTTTVATDPNGGLTFNGFDMKTEKDYPTMREIISASMALHPEQRNVAVIAVTEMSEIDFHKFGSEQ